MVVTTNSVVSHSVDAAGRTRWPRRFIGTDSDPWGRRPSRSHPRSTARHVSPTAKPRGADPPRSTAGPPPCQGSRYRQSGAKDLWAGVDLRVLRQRSQAARPFLALRDEQARRPMSATNTLACQRRRQNSNRAPAPPRPAFLVPGVPSTTRRAAPGSWAAAAEAGSPTRRAERSRREPVGQDPTPVAQGRTVPRVHHI